SVHRKLDAGRQSAPVLSARGWTNGVGEWHVCPGHQLAPGDRQSGRRRISTSGEPCHEYGREDLSQGDRYRRDRMESAGRRSMSRLTDAIAAERRRLAAREADAVRRLLAYHDVILDALTDDLQAVTEMIEAAIRNGEPVNIDWLRRQERYHR